VFVAVMELGGTSDNPVYDTLDDIHTDPNVFSFGISNAPKSGPLFIQGQKTGLLVSGRPGATLLPPPLNQVPQFRGDEFVVCGFRGEDPVVYRGSSNLALGREQANGDNLLAIRDADVATAFVIEALALIDLYQFLDELNNKSGTTPVAAAAQEDKRTSAVAWAQKYLDPNDLHCADRQLFGS
jgi:hypothetical protein